MTMSISSIQENVNAGSGNQAAASAPKRWTVEDIALLEINMAGVHGCACGVASSVGLLGPNARELVKTCQQDIYTSTVAGAAHGEYLQHNIRLRPQGTGFYPNPTRPKGYAGDYSAEYVGPERPADLLARRTGTGLGAGVFLLGLVDMTHSVVATYSNFGNGESPYGWLDQFHAPGRKYAGSAETFDELVRVATYKLVNNYATIDQNGRTGLKATKLHIWQIPPR
jgi:hypothetical protein